jgi:predicted nuclease of predicted toxin-antitoxin system
LRFLVDAQLPPALARWLASRGHEAAHVFDRGLTSADDRTIWRDAESTDSIILTKDEDFALLKAIEPEGPKVVWIRLGNTRRQALLEWFEQMLPEVLVALERGDSLIEVS